MGDPEDFAAKEAVHEEPRLQRYFEHFGRWDEVQKTKCPWSVYTRGLSIKERLLANEGRYLVLAEAMVEGGILFGIDEEGNPLIADGGTEAILTGMLYPKTREAVYPDYEMFPSTGDRRKSPEVLAFEKFTGHPFIYPPKKNDMRSSWLESGERLETEWAWFAAFSPVTKEIYIDSVLARNWSYTRGSRRLLRLKAS